MKKVFCIIILVFAFCLLIVPLSTNHFQRAQERRMIKEVVINYSKNDSEYIYHGYYKKVLREYNYTFFKNRQVTVLYKRNLKSGEGIWIEAWINEFGDTSRILYIDLTNYPRREDVKYAN